MPKWDTLREAGKNSTGNMVMPSGSDLMRRINAGTATKAPIEYVEKVKGEVTEALDELLDFGARIRPLFVDKEQVGWVRGLYPTEGRILRRWIPDPNTFTTKVLTLTTTFTPEEIERFTAKEIYNLVELVRTMGDYDASLYPYMSAFVTTMVSENLWHGKGTKLTSFENRLIELPDGKRMKVLTPPDHARIWATLCTYREQAKKRMDENFNAVLIVRPTAGKSVNPIHDELTAMSRKLRTDSMEPWENLIRFNVEASDDGWAHPENIESKEGMLKELYGMLNNDKHEQVMAEFEKKLLTEAEEQRARLEELVRTRGGVGISEETMVIETDEDIRRRSAELRKGRVAPPPPTPKDTETALNPRDKLLRYS